jgi:hypothetical protein
MKVKTIVREDKFLEITLKNLLTDNTAVLHYAVLDHRVALKWVELLEYSIDLNQEITQNYRRYRSPEEIQMLFDRFLNTIDFINSEYDIELERPESFELIDDDIMNRLHDAYEYYGTRIQHLIETNRFKETVHEKFLRLNELIHTLQTCKRLSGALRLCTVDFLPVGSHLPLEKEDYFLFTTDHQWGWIYLGYNTLGKPWTSVSFDDDIASIVEDRVRPQKRYAAEFSINFNNNTLAHWKRSYFYKWWLENNISNTVNPDMKLAELGLGTIPLAILLGYTTDAITVINPDLAIGKFNNEIWDKFDTVDSVKIVRAKDFNKTALKSFNEVLSQFK